MPNPYTSVVGYEEKSAYAARQVEDKEGLANPKLPQLKYQDEKKQYNDLVNMFQPTFGLAFSVENQNRPPSSTAPSEYDTASSGPNSDISSAVGSEPIARLSDVLRRSSETANELLSQRESLRSLSEEFFNEDQSSESRSSAAAYSADISGSDRDPSSGSSMSIDGSSYRRFFNELRSMDERLAQSSISDPSTLSSVMMDIDSTYSQLTTNSDLIRELLRLRLEDVESEIRRVSSFARDVEEAVRSAASPLSATSSRQSLLSQAVSTASMSRSENDMAWALGQTLIADAYERASTGSLRSNRSRNDDDVPRILSRLQERYPNAQPGDDLFTMAARDGFNPYRMPESLPNYNDVPPQYEVPPAYEALNNRLETIRRRSVRTSSSEDPRPRRSTRRRRSAPNYRGMQNSSASSGSNYSG